MPLLSLCSIVSASVSAQTLDPIGSDADLIQHHQTPRVYSITDKDRLDDGRFLGQRSSNSLNDDLLGEVNHVRYSRHVRDRMGFPEGEITEDSLALQHARRMRAWFAEDDLNNLGGTTYEIFNDSLSFGHRLELDSWFKDSPSTDLKIGPLYIDLLWLDFHGRHTETWTSSHGHQSDDSLALSIRSVAYLRLTNTWFLSIYSSLGYDFVNERLTYYYSSKMGADVFLGTFMNYSTRIQRWDFSLSHEFSGAPAIGVYLGGMYDFDGEGSSSTYLQDESDFDNLYDKASVFFVNALHATLRRSILDQQWDLSFFAGHKDIWRTFDFVDYTSRDEVGARLDYRGNVIPWSPSLRYNAVSHRGGPWYHRADVYLHKNVSPNVQVRGHGGYAIRETDTHGEFLWDVGIVHRYSPSGMQSLEFGQNIFDSDYLPVSTYQSFLHYNIHHKLGEYHSIEAYYKWANHSEDWSGTDANYFDDEGALHVLGTRLSWWFTPRIRLDQTLQWYHRSSFDRITYSLETIYTFNRIYSLRSYYLAASQKGNIDRSLHQVGFSMRRSF